MRPCWQRAVAVAACAAALVACSGGGGELGVGEVEQADTGYITCDDLIIWRADYGEIGEAVTYDAEIPDAIFDPDPTPWIGQLRCPPPSSYEYDTELVVINLYWSPDPPPDAPYPDAWVLADAAHDASDAGSDANDGPLADAAPVDAADAGFDAGGHDGGMYVADASVTYGGVMYMAPPQGGGRPVQPRPVVPARPGPPVTQVPLPPGATRPPPRVVEPQGVRTPAAAVTPRFIDPQVAIQQTATPAYRAQLWTELLLLDPAFGVQGNRVHMGYWSGNGRRNIDALRALLDDINTNAGPNVRAFFDEGLGPNQLLPSYRAMTRADWYGRARLVDGRGSLDGGATRIIDPHPTTLDQANTIWGQYSQRYAQMALDAHSATGNVVDVWSFVENAAIDRVFYRYELPVLRDLETLGVVRVHFARRLDARYNNPADWIVGTANAPPAAPPVNPPPLGPP